jgi:hypothetical protein
MNLGEPDQNSRRKKHCASLKNLLRKIHLDKTMMKRKKALRLNNDSNVNNKFNKTYIKVNLDHYQSRPTCSIL